MLKFRRLLKPFLLLLFSLSVAGCTAQTEAQKKFGTDADYFIGLRLLSEGNEKEAREKFNHCIKKGSYYCAKKSAEALCTFGNIQEKNLAAENLLAKYKEEDCLLIAAKQFKSSGEINRLIEATNGLDFSKAKNELIRIRLEAMGKRGDSAYEAEVYRWFTECPISTEHYQFYRDFYIHDDEEYTPRQFAIKYRIESYKRNYTWANQSLEELLSYFENGSLKPNAQLASDTGKNVLYGSMSFAKNAAKFQQAAEKYKDTPAEFYLWFYAGRLYDKAGLYFQQSKKCFENAMASAQNASQKDNALWYLLTTSLNFSVDSIISSIGKYSQEWNDPEYFEDFFESLIPSLLASGKWNVFGDIYRELDDYASDLTTAQFAYIYARLIQEGLAGGTQEDMQNAFVRACNSGTSGYYKVLAAYRLGIEPDSPAFKDIMTQPQRKTKPAESSEVEKSKGTPDILLEGYVDFGFPELIYPEYQKYANQLSVSTCFYISDFLAKCAETDNDKYYTQALRIAAKAQLGAAENISLENLSLVYPQYYKKYVEKYCAEYKVPESVMYALIRSESFFDPDVESSAGAVGLTQLMEFTAGDIARRFKIQDYSLTDPETNIRFGTWYLENQVSRCDNTLLLGFFSYNAGINRVRRWQQSSLIEFDKKSNMPLDLFLETVPIAETREYGRKLISATAAYQYIYNENDYTKMIETLLH